MTLRRNIIANYLGRVYSIAAIYLLVPLYVHILGIDAYAVIAAYTVLLTLASLADIGLSATFSREAARCSNEKKLLDLLATIERILILTVGFIAIIIFIGAEFIVMQWLDYEGEIDRNSIIWSFRLMALMIVPHICVTLYSAGLLGLQKQVKANIIQSLFVTVRSGLVILPILWQPELPFFFVWQLVATLVFALLTRIVLVREIGYSGWQMGRFDTNALKEKLIFAGGMMWIAIVSSLNTQIDKILVSKMFSLTEFGYYSLASMLSLVPVAFATPIAVAFYPFVTKHVANRNKVQEVLGYEIYGQWIAFMGALGALGIAFFAPHLLEIWLQDSNLPPVFAEITALLAIGSLFLCLGIPSFYLSLAHGESWLIAKLVTITLLASIPLMIVCVQKYGLLGITFPWIILNFANLLLMIIIATRRHLGLGYISCLGRTLGLPVAIVFFPFLGAHYMSSALQVSPFWAFFLACAGGLCAVTFFVTLRHIYPLRANEPEHANVMLRS